MWLRTCVHGEHDFGQTCIAAHLSKDESTPSFQPFENNCVR